MKKRGRTSPGQNNVRPGAGVGHGKKMLMLASVASMIDQFNMPNIRLLQSMGYEVHVACNFRKGNTCDDTRIHLFRRELKAQGVVCHQWDCPRDVRAAGKCIKACLQLWRLAGRHEFRFIHCHSPAGGALARAVAHLRGIPVIYTAHGFHFYKGAPLKNWVFYYPVEWLLSWWTDVLVTINREDYIRAKKHFHAKKTCRVPGVGLDVSLFTPDGMEPGHTCDFVCDRKTVGMSKAGSGRILDVAGIRESLGLSDDTFLLLHVAELSKRKNHKIVLRALCRIEKKYKGKYDYRYVLCGIGAEQKTLEKFVRKSGLSGRVMFLGYREDIPMLMRAADAEILSSYHEGLPVAVMEAMAAGLPVIASRIRGNVELIDKRGGILVDAGDACGFAGAIVRMAEWKKNYPDKLRNMETYNMQKSRKYDTGRVERNMKAVYKSMEGEI